MSDEDNRHVIDTFEGSQFRDLVESLACPECDQPIRFTRFEGDGETECPRCQSTLRLEVVVDGGRNPAE